MKYSEDQVQVVLVKGQESLTLTSDQFHVFELDAPLLPEGMIRRVWTPAQAYVSDGVSQYPDPAFDGSGYCNKISVYTEQLTVRNWTFAPVEESELLAQDDNVLAKEEDELL